MSVTVSLDELLGYSDHERKKWQEWIAADAARLTIPFQDGGRFATVGQLFDHLFLVERRHLARLQGSTPPDATGVAPGDWKALFDYAGLVRADLRHFVTDLDAGRCVETLTFDLRGETCTMTPRKLVAHILLHEVRHLAQAAYAARLAGHEPPGTHDLFYYADFV